MLSRRSVWDSSSDVSSPKIQAFTFYMLIYIFENDCQDSLAVLWPNMFGEGSLSCMPLASCSLTWSALRFVFFLFSLPQCFTAQWEDKCNYSNWSMSRRTPSCREDHWADHHFQQDSKMTLAAAVSHFIGWLRSVPCLESSTLLLAVPASLLPLLFPPPSLQISTHITRQVFSCLALRCDEPLKESWLQKYTKH